MRWTRAFIPTLKETPSDAEIASHRLMLRSGMIRKLSSGIYNLLPLGMRSTLKAAHIVRQEMNRTGAHELLMPVLSPAELWRESGRWDVYGDELMRIRDRHKRSFGRKSGLTGNCRSRCIRSRRTSGMRFARGSGSCGPENS